MGLGSTRRSDVSADRREGLAALSATHRGALTREGRDHARLRSCDDAPLDSSMGFAGCALDCTNHACKLLLTSCTRDYAMQSDGCALRCIRVPVGVARDAYRLLRYERDIAILCDSRAR